MDVGLEDVGDGDFPLAGQLEIDLHVGPRIDDGRRAGLVVADQIRQLRDAFGLHGLENHGHAKFSFGAPRTGISGVAWFVRAEVDAGLETLSRLTSSFPTLRGGQPPI